MYFGWTNLIQDFVNFCANKTNPSEFQCACFSFVQKITIGGCVITVDKAECGVYVC